jgi:hypothetical protein
MGFLPSRTTTPRMFTFRVPCLYDAIHDACNTICGGPFLGSLCPLIFALIAMGRLGSAEPPDVPTGRKDVEALGTPTPYSVDVERYRFGTTDVRNPASYPIPRHPVTRETVTFEESSPARVAPVWNTHSIGPPLGQHGHAPTGRRERHAQQEGPAAGRAARQARLAGSSRVWYTPRRLFPSIGNSRYDDFQ